MKKHFPQIKKIVKEKDNRFWLMIFVVVSTLAVFIIWISDFNNIFFNDKKAKSSSFNLQSIKEENTSEFNDAFSSFSGLLEQNLLEMDDVSSGNLSSELEQSLIKKLEEKNRENKEIEKDSSGVIEIDELRESEEGIDNLKKRIEELEQKMESNN